MKTKVAIFDFDNTIVNIDSIFILWRDAMKNFPKYRRYYLIHFIPSLIRWLFNRHGNALKDLIMPLFAYYSEEELRDFVLDHLLKEYMFEEAREEVLKCHDEGYMLILTSASPTAYLKYVGEVLPLDTIIGTDMTEDYRLLGKNNRHEEKVRRLHELFKSKGLEVDYELSRAYSDSLDQDGPMLKLVKNRYVINDSNVPEGYHSLIWKQSKK